MKRVTSREATRLRQLENRLGSRLVRTILTDPNRRLMRPERIENLKSGRGKLSSDERKILGRLSANADAAKRLSEKQTIDERRGRKRKEFKVNRSIRDFVQHGKQKGAPREPGTDEQKVIRGLSYLGVDPSEKHYYIRKVKA